MADSNLYSVLTVPVLSDLYSLILYLPLINM